MRRFVQHRSVYRAVSGGALTLAALAALAFSACEHADSVKALEERAKRNSSGASSGAGGVSSGSSGTTAAPSSFPTGPVPEELLVEEELIGAGGQGGATGAPLVEEANRISCGSTAIGPAYVPDPTLKAEAESLLRRMDINQKVLQLTGVENPLPNAPNRFEDIQRSRDDVALNIRGYQWRDGPHGLNLESGLGRDPLQNYATSFPTSVAQGASFDVGLVYRMGEAMGDETLASRNNVLLAPCMNLLRHPFWGRAQETFGEDTFHLGRIATAYTRGLQQFVSGCAKHYVANNIEDDRDSISSDMDEQTLREVYGRHFEMVVRDGGVGCIMASYNLVNGTKSTQNRHTLTTMLREDMGFQGFVLTDWWAMPGAQGPVDPPQDGAYAREALEAGLDVEVPWTLNFDAIPRLVQDGALSVDYVNRAVLRVLEQKLRFNTAYMGGPWGPKATTTSYDDTLGSIRNTEQHVRLAAEAAEKGMVLLKNDGGVLPIKSATTVAVVGATVEFSVFSDNPQTTTFNFATQAALGDRGSSRVRPDPALTVGPFDGIRAAAPGGGTVTLGASGADAASADVAVVVVGNTPGDEGEEYTGASDRERLALRDEHNNLVNEVVAARSGKPTIVVIESGGVVAMPWHDDVDAVIMAWYPGQRGGEALGRLLFGQANFAGRLPVTWPRDEEQLPAFSTGEATAMDYYAGYRRFDQLGLEPLYAFGHGLSYSSFSYERLHIPCGDISKDGVIAVEVDVRNIDGPAGDEVILVFASYPETQARRSLKELKGFARVYLEPGQAKRVTIPIRVNDLKYWDMALDDWVIEQGPVLFQVGPSSDSPLLEQLRQTVTIH